jgi:Ferric uptake regulator family
MTPRVEASDQEVRVFGPRAWRRPELHRESSDHPGCLLGRYRAGHHYRLVASRKEGRPRTSHSTVWRLLKALFECGLAHREISPADGVLRYRPVKMECTHERVACKDCGAAISQEGGQHEHVENVRRE